MYDKNDKRRLYWLIDQYLSGKINEPVFCNEFYYSYDLEVNNDILTDMEKVAFAELSKVSSRFSQYEEDHKLNPSAFSTAEELRRKIIEVKGKLQYQNPL
ncbi:magnesium and cobalt transport protein CorA [Taibaiella sp. KBW10]|uniref:magnesium and cobalt transport protein CorA n=1 Tax=Taibaiella sp. KBW10 TaxID=2153357 RepID=UPI000F599D19|nr:magnesium and cobalt transport protein CorA [Taibaiella sp. KBW10]RQO30394.1 magnesium and cobalt transport protein CorA [Taibaiella sp. KBW10]